MITINQIEKQKIDSEASVTLKKCGKIFEIRSSNKRFSGGHIKKLDNDYYMKANGEVLKFNHIENRAQDKANVAKTISNIRDIINTNVVDAEKCLWQTLTYKENMTDARRLYNDFYNYIKQLRRKYQFEYIAVAEPQGRGAWHMHIILIFKDKAPYIDNNSVIEKIWKHGFTNTRAVSDIDNVGLYFSCYLGDLELSEAEEAHIKYDNSDIKEVELEGKSKRFVKGARLNLYPPKFNMYRCSRGIEKPVIEKLSYKTAKEKVSRAELTFQKSIEISDTETQFTNILTYEYYNSAVKNKQ